MYLYATGNISKEGKTLKGQLSLSSRSFIKFKVIPPVQIKYEAKTIWGKGMAQK